MNTDSFLSTLEPKSDHFLPEGTISNNEFYSSNTNSATDEDEEGPLKNYLSTRKLPALDSLSHNIQQQQQDDYIRLKLSGMSVCVSPNSPRGQTTLERGAVNEYCPSSTTAITNSITKAFDPIRSNIPLRRIIEDNNGRRHSIASMDSNRPNFESLPSSSSSSCHHYNHQQQQQQPQHQQQQHQHQQQHQQQQQQQQQYHHHTYFPGHYSAPSSPPLQSLSRSRYNDTIPHQNNHSIRRNSSALINREKSILETRRVSLNQYSRNSHMGKSVEEEQEGIHMKDDMEGLYSRSPELRISHKLAERKRRKEMKDLFEELKDALPVDKTLKTSKWEILTKAVEYITLLRDKDQNLEQELITLKHQLETIKK